MGLKIKSPDQHFQFQVTLPKGKKDFQLKIISYSLHMHGSSAELRTQIYIGLDIDYIDKEKALILD